MPVTLRLPGEPDTTGVAVIEDRGLPERTKRAAKGLLALWGAGALCAFVPLAHFVLVPGFLLAGVILAVVRLRLRSALARVEGVCPRCKVERTLLGSGRYREGGMVHCEGCGSQLEVRALAAGPAHPERADAQG